MRRRQFITKIPIGLLGIYLIPTLISCESSSKLDLDTIIGKSEDILSENENKEGDNDFCTYEVKNFKSKYNIGTLAYIYCMDKKIVGFTIKIENDKQINLLIHDLDKENNVHILNYENEFGKEYLWENNDKKIKLSFNILKTLPDYCFYSVIDSNSNLIV